MIARTGRSRYRIPWLGVVSIQCGQVSDDFAGPDLIDDHAVIEAAIDRFKGVTSVVLASVLRRNRVSRAPLSGGPSPRHRFVVCSGGGPGPVRQMDATPGSARGASAAGARHPPRYR